jgi:glycosyltransferase involved in cell wall biosynthesis
MRILAIAETFNFNNYTRRATFESIGEFSDLNYLVVNNQFKSEEVIADFNKDKIIQIKSFLPKRSKLFKLESQFLQFYYKRKLKNYDLIIITSPNQEFLLKSLPKRAVVIFLISDPYHLMGDIENKTIKAKTVNILKYSDIILTTSKNLGKIYLPKYFNYSNQSNVFYWPNCVNEKIWSLNVLEEEKIGPDERKVIGFAGNFMNITDVELLDLITTEFKECSFRIAGKVSFESHRELLDKVFAKANVEYLNFIPYDDLPKEVYTWDVCLLLDKQSEYASYHHHNKIYQYLALGKPVVSFDYIRDYDMFRDSIYLSNDRNEYISNIKRAIEELTFDNILIESRKAIANQNSNRNRASEFMAIVNKFKTE